MGKDVTSLVVVECLDAQYGYDWLDTVKNYAHALTVSKTYGSSMPTEVYSNNGQEETFGFEMVSLEEGVFASVVLNSRAEGVEDFVSMTTGREYVVFSRQWDGSEAGVLTFGNTIDTPAPREVFAFDEDRTVEDYKDFVMGKFIEHLRA